jgi:hypothetical protein
VFLPDNCVDQRLEVGVYAGSGGAEVIDESPAFGARYLRGAQHGVRLQSTFVCSGLLSPKELEGQIPWAVGVKCVGLAYGLATRHAGRFAVGPRILKAQLVFLVS